MDYLIAVVLLIAAISIARGKPITIVLKHEYTNTTTPPLIPATAEQPESSEDDATQKDIAQIVQEAIAEVENNGAN